MTHEQINRYNRRRWICFMKNLAMPSVDFMILVDYQMNTDGSSRTIIPIMKKMITTDDSDSLLIACDMIRDHLNTTFGMAITPKLYCFITVAYHQECLNYMRRDVKRWWSDKELLLQLETMIMNQEKGGEE